MDIKLGIIVDATKAVAGSRQAQKAIRGIGTAASTASNRILGAASSLLRLTTAASGLTAVGLAPTFIRTASTVQQLNLRMSVMLGSVEEGNRLFEDMVKFASGVPHEFEQIMKGATQLSGVMKGGVDEINQWMPIISDLAAVSGLGIEKTTEQVVRMYSAGAGAADLFRERGINAMLGFQAGVATTAEETRARLIAAFEDPASKFRGASELLANTWSGTLSMMRDKWFNFQKEFSERSGLFNYFKAIIILLDRGMGNALEQSKGRMESWGASIIGLVKRIAMGVAGVLDVLRGPFDIIASSVDFIWQGFKQLPAWAQDIGVIGALMFGKTGVAALAAGSVLAKDNKITAEWFKAFSEDKISFWEWITSGSDAAQQKLKQMQMMTGEIKRGVEEVKPVHESLFPEGSFRARLQEGFSAIEKVLEEIDQREKEMAEKFSGARGVEGGPGTDNATQQKVKEQQESALQAWRNNEAQKLTELEESYMTQLEREQLFYDNRQMIIDNAYLNEQISSRKHDDLLLKEKARHEKAVRKLDTAVKKQALSYAGTFFNSMMALTQGNSKQLFNIMKVGAIATAIVDTYTAAANALADVRPYPLNIAAAAAVTAAGLARVNAIRSTDYSSEGGIGGVGVGGGVVPQPVPSVPTEVQPITGSEGQNSVRVEILGDIYGFDDYVEEKLINAIKSAVDDRDVVLISSDSRNAQEILASG